MEEGAHGKFYKRDCDNRGKRNCCSQERSGKGNGISDFGVSGIFYFRAARNNSCIPFGSKALRGKCFE